MKSKEKKSNVIKINRSSKHKESLSKEEASDLHSALRYYGRKNINSIVHNMFTRDETPLVNSWETEEEFSIQYLTFKKIARVLSEKDFYSLTQGILTPSLKSLSLNEFERKILTDKSLIPKICFDLSKFFFSIPDYFEYDIKLISLGYPCDRAS